jgi:hypothetical protein
MWMLMVVGPVAGWDAGVRGGLVYHRLDSLMQRFRFQMPHAQQANARIIRFKTAR